MKCWMRECYKKGIPKEENKLYEFHAYCECQKCKWRNKYLKEPKNALTLTTDSKEKFDQVIEFINNWKCKDGNNKLPVEYIHI